MNVIETKMRRLRESLAAPSTSSSESTSTSTSNADKDKDKDKESKSSQKKVHSRVDEQESHMCFLLGAYLEEAIPEVRKTAELDLLCQIYRAKLALLAGNFDVAKNALKGSQKRLKAALADPGLFPPTMMKPIQSQYLALIRAVKAEVVRKP